MSRILILIILSFLASSVAILLKKLNKQNFVTSGWSIPGHIDRQDFEFPNEKWLAMVFSSNACKTCEPVVAKSMKLTTLGIAVQEVPLETKKHLHEKYAIDAVPMLLLTDKFGVVQSSYLGPVDFEDVKKSFEVAISETSMP